MPHLLQAAFSLNRVVSCPWASMQTSPLDCAMASSSESARRFLSPIADDETIHNDIHGVLFIFVQIADLFDVGHLSIDSHPGKTVFFKSF